MGSIRGQFKSDDADDDEGGGKEPERRRRLAEKNDARRDAADGAYLRQRNSDRKPPAFVRRTTD